MINYCNEKKTKCYIKMHIHSYDINDIWIRYSLVLINLNEVKNVNECIDFFPISNRINYVENFKPRNEIKKILYKIVNAKNNILYAADQRTNNVLYEFTGQRLLTIKMIYSDFPTVILQNDLYKNIEKCILSHFVNDSENDQFDIDQFWLETYIAYKYIIKIKNN